MSSFLALVVHKYYLHYNYAITFFFLHWNINLTMTTISIYVQDSCVLGTHPVLDGMGGGMNCLLQKFFSLQIMDEKETICRENIWLCAWYNGSTAG